MIDLVPSTRERIITAAIDLLTSGGRQAVSTRAVSAAAGVQPPAIYRQFGDMQGLLDAVADRGFASYIESKTNRVRADDPVDDLRSAWDLHVSFGLANPELYVLMYGDPRSESSPSAASRAADILDDLVERIARAGRLRTDVRRAAAMIGASGVGVTLTLLARPPEDQDLSVSELTREALLAALTVDAPGGTAAFDSPGRRVAAHSVALRSVLPEATGVLTPGERTLLAELLDRLIRTGS
ncbi:MAG: hypothetical protein AVDCRST_MAG33-1695 [uncultured Thermomicrobiales bacterium]|uniref:HTH tetR-type domain-containing protein n=1 Tax=uncultured Thermomicrobiales bacterium TaxID=1645740 RepID=A0A6J4UZU5_9BACT|nr:MAG: hypothetical protein AVDCRST_MAG33-1695 [uncultured Thermomicrobiales bacterium]